MGYANLPPQSSGATTNYLALDTTLIVGNSSTIFVPDLDAPLEANSLTRITWYLALVNNDATGYYRQFCTFPADMVGYVTTLPIYNAGSTPTTVTPGPTDVQITGIGAQIGAGNIYLTQIIAHVKSGPTGGTVLFGIRNVANTTDATMLADFSCVEILKLR